MKAKHDISQEEYKRYMGSPEWRAFRKRYKASNLPQRCMICNQRKVQLHHLTYVRFGHEELTDVIPLCQTHHNDVHNSRIPEPKPKIPPKPDRVDIIKGREYRVLLLPPLERGWTPYYQPRKK